jgi:hypothetical protein
MAEIIPRKPPTKRALKGAQKVGRHDMETGVSSRARKRIQGLEIVPDPRLGARAGRNSKKFPTGKVLPKKVLKKVLPTKVLKKVLVNRVLVNKVLPKKVLPKK